MNYPVLNILLIMFALILTITVIFRYLNLPVILGYLVVGALLSPHALGWIHHLDYAQRFARFGVVFLMFTVGLEFSLPKMIALRYEVFLLGGTQVIATMMLVLLISKLFGMTGLEGLIISGVVAMSSTAIVAKQLSDQRELHHRFAQNAIGILLFQDLAVIPFLILVTDLSGNTSGMTSHLLLALIKGIIVILVILTIGRWLFRPLFHAIAATHLIELFTIAVLLIALGAGAVTNYMGLSFPLGAFTAGMMLGETRFRHQIAAEIRPFRDILMGLFFITVGALLDISTWGKTWLEILWLFLGILLGKSLIITFLSFLFKNDKATSFRTGLVLAQGGEFGFAILTLVLNNKLLSYSDGQIVLGALLLSIAVAPFLITFNSVITQWLFPKTVHLSEKQVNKKIQDQLGPLQNHVIICGYGHVGQNIARLLEKKKIAYLALDLDPDRVYKAELAGKSICYGDSTHLEILQSAGLVYAKALVVSFDDTNSAKKILHHVHSSHPRLPTIVRCKNELEFSQLQSYGATQIVVESHEESLMLTFCLLLALGVSRAEAQKLIQNVRQRHSDLLQQIFVDSDLEGSQEMLQMKQLHSVVLPKYAAAIDHSLGSLNLKSIHVTVVALRRNKEYHPNPANSMKLCSNDILLLYGTWENLEQAEEILLQRPTAFH